MRKLIITCMVFGICFLFYVVCCAEPIAISRSVEKVDATTYRSYAGNKYYKDKLGEYHMIDGKYIKADSIAAIPTTTREKCNGVVKLRNDGLKTEYMSLYPDETYGLPDSDKMAEYMKWELVDFKFDDVSIPINTTSISKDGDYVYDVGSVKIYGDENLNRQLISWPDKCKAGVLIFKITVKGLNFTYDITSDTYIITSKNSGDFRFRIRKPVFADKNYRPLNNSDTTRINDFYGLIDHTLVDNHDGTWTYTKTTKDLLGVTIPEGSYIDAEIVYSSTKDGYVRTTFQATWADAHDAATGDSVSDNDNSLNYAFETCYSLSQYFASRGYFYFLTSSIPGNIVTVDLKGYAINLAVAQTIYAMKGTQADTLTTADFDAFSGSAYGSTTWTAGAYRTISFNSTGISEINQSGTTKICLRMDKDYNDVAPTACNQRNGIYFADNTGTDKDPYLEITVSAGGAPTLPVVTYGF
ncbi:MAG: hypothetical protein U9P90_01545 [Patescibacteria group bacterium]|nr:hypothetical protein [Patescibacteria group bacterium]